MEGVRGIDKCFENNIDIQSSNKNHSILKSKL